LCQTCDIQLCSKTIVTIAIYYIISITIPLSFSHYDRRKLSQVSHYSRKTMIQIDCNQLGSIPNINLGPLAMVALDHFWYNSGRMSWVQSAPHTQGTIRPSLPLDSHLAPRTSLLSPVCALLQNDSRPEFSYLASWSKQVIRPAK
jgi:hypothetical protein